MWQCNQKKNELRKMVLQTPHRKYWFISKIKAGKYNFEERKSLYLKIEEIDRNRYNGYKFFGSGSIKTHFHPQIRILSDNSINLITE